MVGNCIIKGALEDRALRFPDQPFSYSRAWPARRREPTAAPGHPVLRRIDAAQ